MLNPIAFLILQVLNIYEFVVVAAVIMSWLTAFNVINVHNNFARAALRILLALTEPVFAKVRRVIPPIGGLDLSPIVVVLLIETIKYAMTSWSPLVSVGW